MTRQTLFKRYAVCMLCMVFLGMLTERAICAINCAYKEVLSYDVNAFLSGKSDKFIGWDIAP